jgi:hypothetical protein
MAGVHDVPASLLFCGWLVRRCGSSLLKDGDFESLSSKGCGIVHCTAVCAHTRLPTVGTVLCPLCPVGPFVRCAACDTYGTAACLEHINSVIYMVCCWPQLCS